MGFLKLEGKRILIFGVANRKSVAFHIAKTLAEEGAEPIFSVQGPQQAETVEKLFPGAPCHLCDVRDAGAMERTATEICAKHAPLYGIVHSLAFANYSEGLKSFHETVKSDFLEALDVSCFSFISLARLYKKFMEPDGAMITISISTTRMAAENYGYMAPIKAALDSSIVFLAKSLSADTRIRVNGVGASLLKTSASAGIPGYLEPYLFAEMATLRKQALKTEEVADVAAFLLSPRASGINAQTIVVDAGMSTNFFDREIVSKATRSNQ
ncbi:MAG: enoyl-ACP reductase [Lentisphaerae bacterium GWF2_52_8]|nr:MAG: enoyl-ACP reductase [Lentisphaerae bacterium GWF2_52_8]